MKRFFCLLIAAGWGGFCLGQAGHSPVLPLDKAVRTGKLANGFTYFIRHNEEPKDRVCLYLVNKVGSILEEDDQRGLAHFMEHMSFNGTKHYPKNELVDYLQRSGVRFGADLNAYTSFDETVYQLPVPTDDPEILRSGFRIMRDWAQEAVLDAAEIDKERGVVLEEKRLGKGAQERMQRLVLPLMLNHSRYAERLPIGVDTVLDHFKPEVIRRFYKDWYRPDLQALIVVGDVDVDAVEKQVRVQFADLKNPAQEKARVKYKTELAGKNQFLAVTDKEMPATVLQVLIKHKARGIRTEADYRAAIIRSLFNQMLGARYQELSRRADPPFVDGSAGIGGLLAGLDAYQLSVTAKPGELEKGFKAVWRETERLSRFGFTQGELDRAKKVYLSGMEMAMKEKGKSPSESLVKEYQAYFLDGTAAPGVAAEYRLVKGDLPLITLSAVNALRGEYIKDKDRDIIIEAPESERGGLPAESAVLGWMASVRAEKLLLYKDTAKARPLVKHLLPAGRVVSEKRLAALGVTELVLSNGLKVVLKPTAFKNDEVLFQAFAPGGTSVLTDGDYLKALDAAAIIPACGLGGFSATELEKQLAGKELSVEPFIGERSQGLAGASAVNDLETALQLAYLYFTAAQKDKGMFDNLISRSRAAIADRGNDPNSVFSDTVLSVLRDHQVRYAAPSVERLNGIDLDRCLELFRSRFADASGFTFVFTGNFEVEKIKPLLLRYLGSLPALHKGEQAVDLHIHVPEGSLEKVVYKGSEPKATVQLMFTGGFEYSPLHNAELKALAEVLEIRLLERLREEESGVYSPACSADMVKLPENRFGITIRFGCAPANVDRLVASAMEEIAVLKRSGPPQVNLDKYLAEHRRTREVSLKTNAFWLGYLSGAYADGEDLYGVLKDKEVQDRLTVAGLKEAANRFFGKNCIRFVLMPEQVASGK